MSQNMRNEQGDSWNKSNQLSDNVNSGRNYEGFEGMNFEQARQPYNPDKKRDRKGMGSRNSNGEEKDR